MVILKGTPSLLIQRAIMLIPYRKGLENCEILYKFCLDQAKKMYLIKRIYFQKQEKIFLGRSGLYTFLNSFCFCCTTGQCSRASLTASLNRRFSHILDCLLTKYNLIQTGLIQNVFTIYLTTIANQKGMGEDRNLLLPSVQKNH